MSVASNPAPRPIESDAYIPPGSDQRMHEPNADERPDENEVQEEAAEAEKAEGETKEAGAFEKVKGFFGWGRKETEKEEEDLDNIEKGEIGETKVDLTAKEKDEVEELRKRVYDAGRRLKTVDLRKSKTGSLREQREALYWLYEDWVDEQKKKEGRSELSDEVTAIYRKLGKTKGAKYADGSYNTLTEEENAMVKEAEGRNLTDVEVLQMINGEIPWHVGAYTRAMEMLDAKIKAEDEDAKATKGSNGKSGSGAVAVAAVAGAAAIAGSLLAGKDVHEGHEYADLKIEVDYEKLTSDIEAKIKENKEKISKLETDLRRYFQDGQELIAFGAIKDARERISSMKSGLGKISEYARLADPEAASDDDAASYAEIAMAGLKQLDKIGTEQERQDAQLKHLENLLKLAVKGLSKARTEADAKLQKLKKETENLDEELDKARLGKEISGKLDAKATHREESKKIDELEKKLAGLQNNFKLLDKEGQEKAAKEMAALQLEIMRLFDKITPIKTKEAAEPVPFSVPDDETMGIKELQAEVDRYRKARAIFASRRPGTLSDIEKGYLAAIDKRLSEAASRLAVARADDGAAKKFDRDAELKEAKEFISKLPKNEAAPPSPDEVIAYHEDVEPEAVTAKGSAPAAAAAKPRKDASLADEAESMASDAYQGLAKGHSRIDDKDQTMADRTEKERQNSEAETISKAQRRIGSEELPRRLAQRRRGDVEADLKKMRAISNIEKIAEYLADYLELEESETGSLSKKTSNQLRDELTDKIEKFLAAAPDTKAIMDKVAEKLTAEQKGDMQDLGKMSEDYLEEELANIRQVTGIKTLKNKFAKRGYATAEELDKLSVEDIKIIREQIEHDLEHLIRTIMNKGVPAETTEPIAPDQTPEQVERTGIRAEAWKEVNAAIRRREAALSSDPSRIPEMKATLDGMDDFNKADDIKRNLFESGFISRNQAKSLNAAEAWNLKAEIENSTHRALEAAEKKQPAAPKAKPAVKEGPERMVRHDRWEKAWNEMNATLKRREAALSGEPESIAFMESVLAEIEPLQLKDAKGTKAFADELRAEFVARDLFSASQANTLNDVEVVALRDELESSTRRALEAAKKKLGANPPQPSAREPRNGEAEKEKARVEDIVKIRAGIAAAKRAFTEAIDKGTLGIDGIEEERQKFAASKGLLELIEDYAGEAIDVDETDGSNLKGPDWFALRRETDDMLQGLMRDIAKRQAHIETEPASGQKSNLDKTQKREFTNIERDLQSGLSKNEATPEQLEIMKKVYGEYKTALDRAGNNVGTKAKLKLEYKEKMRQELNIG